MKNFLKSTAIFACIALLFCACEKDDTETGAGNAPEGVVFSPGENRAQVAWTVPENSDVEGYSVTWKDSEGKTSSTTLLNTVTASSTDRTVYTQLTSLPLGTVSATLKPMSGSGGTTTLTTTVYDATSYESKTPTIYNIDFDNANLTAEIEWGSIDADCFEIAVSYTDAYGDAVTMERAPIDDNMILTNVEAGLSITYTAYFCPSSGLDEVSVDTVATIDTAPYAPTNVVLSPGINRVVASWVLDFTDTEEEEEEEEGDEEEDVEEDTTDDSSTQSGPGGQGGMTQEERIAALKAEITGTIIRCENTTSLAVTTVTIPISDHTDSLNIYSLTLAPGEYNVSLYTMKESGATSSITDASATITVYSDLDYVRTDANQAVIGATQYVAGTGISSVLWSYVPTNTNFIGVEFYYTGFDVVATPVYSDVTDEDGNIVYDEDGNALQEITSYEYSYSATDTSLQTSEVLAAESSDSTDFTDTTLVTTDIENALANENFTYASCFCPTGGYDTIRIYTYETPTTSVSTYADKCIFAEASPLAATSVTLTSGFATTDGVEVAYIDISAAISEITDISSYRLEVSIDGEVDDTLTQEYVATDVAYDSDATAYVITYTIEDAKVGSEYVVTVTSITASFTEATTTSNTLTPYNTATYESLEPVVTAVCSDAATVLVTWESDDSDLYDDITNVAVLYGNQSVNYTLDELKAGVSLILLDQSLVNTLYCTVTYEPSSGDNVITTTKFAVAVEVEPSAPSAVELTSGFVNEVPYINAKVTIPDASSIVSYVVDLSIDGVVTEGYKSYNDVADNVLSYKDNGIEFTIDNATAGVTYIVSVYGVTDGGEKTSTTESNAILAYNTDTYATTLAPTVTATNTIGSTNVVVSFAELSADMTTMTISYAGNTYSDFTYDELISSATIDGYDGTDANKSLKYTVSYKPTTGETEATISDIEVVIPDPVYDIELTNGVYQINTGTGLAAFANIVNGVDNSTLNAAAPASITFSTTADADAKGVLTTDINLSTVSSATAGNWTPIGDYSNGMSFEGEFDGAGYTISNMYIVESSSDSGSCLGLFGAINGATISNVKVNNAYVEGYKAYCVGTIAGYAHTAASVIENCEVSADATSYYIYNSCGGTKSNSQSGNGGSVGGIAGYVSAGTMIRNCNNKSLTVVSYHDVTNSSSTVGGGGGIVGTIYLSYVVGCTNEAAVTYNSSAQTLKVAGGIAALASTSYFIGCTNYGDVTANGVWIGGILGENHAGVSYIAGCSNHGAIYNVSQSTGGVMGSREGGTVYMNGCYNNSTISSNGTNEGMLTGEDAPTFDACYFVNLGNTYAVGSGSVAATGTTTVMVDSVADLNSGVSAMNTAIETAVTAFNTAIGSTYGFTVSSCAYTDGGSSAPTVSVKYSDDSN